jgi:GT2 family glycosyltransferase
MRAGVAAVIVNWNGKEDTLACLASLAAAVPQPQVTIVVDNGSTDGSVAAIRRSFPQVTCLALAENHHFAAGANAGLRRALAEEVAFVWLLNNDVVVAADALGRLLAAAEATGAGIVGPRVQTADGREELGAWWDFASGRIVAAYAAALPAGVTRLPVDYVWGCALLARAETLQVTGLLDERYVAYFEDADLCLRAQRAGYEVVAATDAVVWHGGSRTARRRPWWQLWRRAHGRLRFFWYHATWSQRPRLVAQTVLREWPLLALGTWRGRRRQKGGSDVTVVNEG